MTASRLMGYVRKSRAGSALNVSISVDAFNEAHRYTTMDGSEFVRMVVSLDRLSEVLKGEREVTGISQLVDDPLPLPGPQAETAAEPAADGAGQGAADAEA